MSDFTRAVDLQELRFAIDAASGALSQAAGRAMVLPLQTTSGAQAPEGSVDA